MGFGWLSCTFEFSLHNCEKGTEKQSEVESSDQTIRPGKNGKQIRDDLICLCL
jgi:hypothetical protein